MSPQPLGDEPIELERVDDVAVAAQHVLGHVAEHVHGVLGRRERRGVGELEIGQAIGREAARHRGRDHVDALVDTVAADDLSAEDRPVVRVEDQLRGHARGAGEVGGVVERV